MTDDEILDRVAHLLAERFGLRCSAATRARLESSVRRRAVGNGVSVECYLDLLGRDRSEAQVLVDGLTVQETSFFRDPSHLRVLVAEAARHPRRPLVVWSAGCATGQEPYSIAMALDEAGVADWRVVATDLSRLAVEHTARGVYRDGELRGLSAARQSRYLRRCDDGWQVVDEIRDRVSVSHHNLLRDPIPVAPREATAVFCRNVFIYLQRDAIAAFLARLRPHLVDDGVLFVGGAESLWRVPDGFTLVHLGDAFAYRCTDATPRQRTLSRGATAPRSPGATPTRPVAAARPLALTPVAAPADLAGPAPMPLPLSAVERFRRETYNEPHDPLAHLQLGLSLEAAGDTAAANRAFRAAHAALARSDAAALEARLEGYGVGALRAMLDTKLVEEA